MFQLSIEEFEILKSQFAISTLHWGGRCKRPFAFTEHGAIIAAGVLNTAKAIDISVYVVRAFVRLREYLATHKELAHKLVELEKKLNIHDEAIQSLIMAIRRLMEPPKTKRRWIGFQAKDHSASIKDAKNGCIPEKWGMTISSSTAGQLASLPPMAIPTTPGRSTYKQIAEKNV